MPDANDGLFDLTINDRKIGGYLLNTEHREGGDKARFFLARGFSRACQDPFLASLFAHGRPSHLVGEKVTEFGTKFVYEGPMAMPDGSTWRIRSVWHRPSGETRRFLVTAYPF